jgi:hypothetical protein
MAMEHRWNDSGMVNPKYSEENLPYRRFVHHQGFFVLRHIFIFYHPVCKKYVALGQRLNWGLRGERPATNRLNHSTTSLMLPFEVCFLGFLVSVVT